MPELLDSRDRKLLIGAGIFLVVLVVASALVSPLQAVSPGGTSSSYAPAADGAKGAFLLLQKLGYRVERWEQPPMEIPQDAGGAVLVLAEPFQTASEDERFAIRDFLERGGRVLAAGAAAAAYLPDAASFEEGDPATDKATFAARVPSPLVRGAPEITMVRPYGWTPKPPAQLAVYADEQAAAVVTYPIGKGQVIWWAAATPLANGTIREAGNLALFLNSVGPPAGTRVFWDEYFHGVHGSLWSYFARTPVPWGVAQFGLVFLFILATYSRRQGPLRMPVNVSRLSPLEFVETLGDLYYTAHAGSAATGTANQRLRFLLIRQLGLPGNVSAAAIAAGAGRQLGWEEGPLLDTLISAERATHRGRVSDAESLGLVQCLFDYIARLELRRTPAQERHTG